MLCVNKIYFAKQTWIRKKKNKQITIFDAMLVIACDVNEVQCRAQFFLQLNYREK